MPQTIKIEKILSILLIVFVSLCYFECTNDDLADNKQYETDNDTVQVYDGISINFQLVNDDGIALKTYKEGEQITFKLIVTNSRKEPVKIPLRDELFDSGFFQVFSSDGQLIGKPWDNYMSFGGMVVIATRPGVSYEYICPWIGKANSQDLIEGRFKVEDIPSSNILFAKERDRQPLPKGDYYTKFNINLNDGKVITCKKEFKVQ